MYKSTYCGAKKYIPKKSKRKHLKNMLHSKASQQRIMNMIFI